MKPYVLANGKPPQTDYCYASLIDLKRIPEILGEGKSFEEIPVEQNLQAESTESLWNKFWKSITSFFS
jgi:hypothetical protein